ncbi:Hydrogenase-2 large chain precursor [Pasteurella bettyae]|nr:Hydrogenase-2 large chain precursor [Pasteurella bettyae]
MLKGISTWSLNSENEFRNVQVKIKKLADSGQLGIFANGYFGHPAMKLPPEVNLIAVAHYLQALECQRDANRVVALLGSKSPHIQNLAIGGVANPINLDSPAVLNQERLLYVKACIDRLGDFINQVYKVDAAVFAAFYPEWLTIGKTSGNYLAAPEYPLDGNNDKFALTGGYIENFDMNTFRPITTQKDNFVVQGIKESGKHSWYEDDKALAPWAGLTRPKYTGWDENAKYSWVKAPSFYDKVVEVGPLACLLTNLAAKNEITTKHFNELKAIYDKLAGRTLEINDLHSTLGRIIGRTVHCAALNEILVQQWQLLIDNIGKGDTIAYLKANIPEKGTFTGVGFGEVPRGMLSHWVVIKDGKIDNYQAVVPSTWLAGPRNQNDEMGPYELSVIGTKVADPTKPLEIVRHIHSFDPCMSCAVHVVNTETGETTQVKVL